MTLMMRSLAKCWRIARNAGVAITTSPTQFGQKSAMFMAVFFRSQGSGVRSQRSRVSYLRLLKSCHLSPFRPLEFVHQLAGAVAVLEGGQMDAAAVGFDKVSANHTVLAIIRAFDKHIRLNRLDQFQRRQFIEHGD